MLDFIFAVTDAHDWHKQNLSRNPEHYSWVGRLGPQVVCAVAEAVGVGVHFNTLVQLDPQTTIKYGVVEVGTLLDDLTNWRHVYLAGRMHKPTTALMQPSQAVADAAHLNWHHALSTALALLPPTFTEAELVRTIVGLSYGGDVRLAVGAEDPHKVARIAEGSWDGLHGTYVPLMKAQRYRPCGLEVVGEVTGGQPGGGGGGGGQRGGVLWRQARDPEAQAAALGLLPPGLLHEMGNRLGYRVPLSHLHPGESTQREVVAAALRSGHAQRLARDSLAAIVRRSSIYQAAAGFLAAGGGKAVQYVGAKVGKALRPLLAGAGSAVQQAKERATAAARQKGGG